MTETNLPSPQNTKNKRTREPMTKARMNRLYAEKRGADLFVVDCIQSDNEKMGAEELIKVPNEEKFLVYLEDVVLYYSQYNADAPIRKARFVYSYEEALADNLIRITTEAEEDLGNGRSVLALCDRISGGEYWTFLRAPSMTVQLKTLYEGCLVMDDDVLGIENEILVPPIEQVLYTIYGQIDLSADAADAYFAVMEEVDSADSGHEIILGFDGFCESFETGVNYRLAGGSKVPVGLLQMERALWLCSCFRHYFDFQNPPPFIGINLEKRPNPKAGVTPSGILPDCVTELFNL